jgi:hypothetical protein
MAGERIIEITVNHKSKGDIKLKVKRFSPKDVIEIGIEEKKNRKGEMDLSSMAEMFASSLAILKIGIVEKPEWCVWEDMFEEEDWEFLLDVVKSMQEFQVFSKL